MIIPYNFIDSKRFILQLSWLVSIQRILCGLQESSCRKDSFFRLILYPDDDLHTLNLLDMRTCLCNASRKALAKDILIHVHYLIEILCHHYELLLKITLHLSHVLGR